MAEWQKGRMGLKVETILALIKYLYFRQILVLELTKILLKKD